MNKEFIIQTDVYVFSVPDGQKTLLTKGMSGIISQSLGCLLYTSPSPRDATLSRMPSSA